MEGGGGGVWCGMGRGVVGGGVGVHVCVQGHTLNMLVCVNKKDVCSSIELIHTAHSSLLHDITSVQVSYVCTCHTHEALKTQGYTLT